MKRFARIATFACSTAACLATGCKLGQPQWPAPETMNAKSVDHIRPRAAYEMHCDAAALTFTPLDTDTNHPGYVSEYGVDGCAQRLVYVHLYGSEWGGEHRVEEPGQAPRRVTPLERAVDRPSAPGREA